MLAGNLAGARQQIGGLGGIANDAVIDGSRIMDTLRAGGKSIGEGMSGGANAVMEYLKSFGNVGGFGG